MDYATTIPDYKGYILFNVEDSTSKRDACIKDANEGGGENKCNYGGLPLSKTEIEQQITGIGQSVKNGNMYASLYENNQQIFTASLNDVTTLKQLDTSLLNSTGNSKASVFIGQGGDGVSDQAFWQAIADQNGVLQNNKVTVTLPKFGELEGGDHNKEEKEEGEEKERFYTVVYLAIYS